MPATAERKTAEPSPCTATVPPPRLTQDSQNVIQFASGAVRSADRVGYRWDLMSPIALARYAAACGEGAAKYGDYNWEKGMPVSEILNHGIAHLYAWLAGDRSEDHLGHALWNVASAVHSDVCWPEINQQRSAGCVPPGATMINFNPRTRESRELRVMQAMGLVTQPA